MSASPKTVRIVFVCSGNICRSPMAAALARPLLDEAKIPHRIISAGTLGLMGHSAADNAVLAVAELGLDLSDHRSQAANPGLLMMADVVIVMSPSHTRHLLKREPRLRSKIVELWRHAPESAGKLDEIFDPVGKDLATFITCRDLIQSCLTRWIASLRR